MGGRKKASKGRPSRTQPAPAPLPPPTAKGRAARTPPAPPPPPPPSGAARAAALLAHYPEDERRFLETIAYALPAAASGRAAREAAAAHARRCLERFQCCVFHDALSEGDVAALLGECAAHEKVSAIGEREAAKRSGTRLFNCPCQRGPSCAFDGWRSDVARAVVAAAAPWRDVVAALGFGHVARVEVVTSHAGCRHQGWHVDGARGVTALFALVDVDARRGPTELDFAAPFGDVATGAKVKGGVPGAPARVFAGALPRGSLLLFNANVSHRGTANLSRGDRPVLVLDCSPPCGASDAGFLCEGA